MDTRRTQNDEPVIDYGEAGMFFGGGWVPMVVMNTIFLLWMIAVVIVGVALLWFARSGRSSKTHQTTPPDTTRRPRSKRRKRR